MQKRLPLILALICALAVVFLINRYSKQKEQEGLQRGMMVAKSQFQAGMQPVLVAKVDIPAGKIIEENMLEMKGVPADFIQPRVATSADRVLGRIAAAPISKGEQILLNKITIPGQESKLSMKTPAGKRAISLTIDNISAVGGMVRPGDYVDVIAVVNVPVQAGNQQAMQVATIPLFQNVLVLAVGQEMTTVVAQGATDDARRRAAPAQPQTQATPVITLALNPQEANFIAFIQEQGGKIKLILRSPADSEIQALPPASWDTLFQYLYPQTQEGISPTEEKTEGPKKVSEVEIYRGLKREVVPLGEAR